MICTDSFYRMLSTDWNLKFKYMLTFLLPKEFSIHIEGYPFLVRVNLNLCDRFYTVCISSSAKMNERFIAPPCLVNIVSILFLFSVKGDKSLVIFTRVARLISSCSSKFKHIPYIGAPQVWSLGNHLKHMLMVHCHIAFCIITFLRLW